MVNEDFMFWKWDALQQSYGFAHFCYINRIKWLVRKALVFHSKVAMKGLGGGKKYLQHNTFDLFPGTPNDSDR